MSTVRYMDSFMKNKTILALLGLSIILFSASTLAFSKSDTCSEKSILNFTYEGSTEKIYASSYGQLEITVDYGTGCSVWMTTAQRGIAVVTSGLGEEKCRINIDYPAYLPFAVYLKLINVGGSNWLSPDDICSYKDRTLSLIK